LDTVDDDTMVYNWEYSITDEPLNEDRLELRLGSDPLMSIKPPSARGGETTISSSADAKTANFAGIEGEPRDRAVQGSMGRIVDRSKGTSGGRQGHHSDAPFTHRAVTPTRQVNLRGVEATYYTLRPLKA
jgi:hypothetical protein